MIQLPTSRRCSTACAVLAGAAFLLAGAVAAQRPRVATTRGEVAPYFPAAGSAWERRTAAQAGLDSARLAAAVAFAIASEVKNPRSMEENHYRTFGREPYGAAVGPFRDRGDATGVILRHGYIVAEWGDPDRVDMTHSVTKSLLSSVVGVALDRRLIRSLDDSVFRAVGPVPALPGGPGTSAVTLLDPFGTPHNRTITWNHLLRQVSDWEGTLWGKPEWADRPTGEPSQWRSRPRVAAGTVYEYNDVRVNALALAALQVWRRPLPAVLREFIMEPIGASTTWQWTGYETSWVLMDGQAVQSVSGGGHWGGGLFISARDMARFGYLTLRNGRWHDRQVLSEAWVRQARTPTPAQPTYGFMNWFLNTDRKYMPAGPATMFFHVGNGTNIVIVDPDHDLVAVVRWIENGAVNGFVERLLAALDTR
ncbi:MAG: serine hydrolase [Gemmatimonadaceae bacterium]|nr:serine hydrolase [Gemmatimonadaceae bacterium]